MIFVVDVGGDIVALVLENWLLALLNRFVAGGQEMLGVCRMHEATYTCLRSDLWAEEIVQDVSL